MAECGYHGVRYRDGGTCPECRKEELDRQHEELLETIRDSESDEIDYDEVADKINNPGDWECPWCLFYTLQYHAWRCSKCHAQFNNQYHQQYWAEVDEEIREDEEAKARQAAEAKAKAEADARAYQQRIQQEAEAKRAEAKRASEACFVATVCFGDRMAPEVVALRGWRDGTLSRFLAGRLFIRLYYSGCGRACANWIEDKGRLKTAGRTILNLLIHYGQLSTGSEDSQQPDHSTRIYR